MLPILTIKESYDLGRARAAAGAATGEEEVANVARERRVVIEREAFLKGFRDARAPKENPPRRIDATIPAATLGQRLAAMSEPQLMDAARDLARAPGGDAACTAVLEELERRVPGPAFETFVAELYTDPIPNPPHADLVYVALDEGEVIATSPELEGAISGARAHGDRPLVVEALGPDVNPAIPADKMAKAAWDATGLGYIDVEDVTNNLSVAEAHERLLPLFERLERRGAPVAKYGTPVGMADAFLGQNYKTGKDHPEEPSEAWGLTLFPADKLLHYRDYDSSPFARWLGQKAGRMGMRTLCAGSNAMCREACLLFTGRNPTEIYNHQRKALLTYALLADPAAFVMMLVTAINRRQRMVERGHGAKFYVRLNVLSDIPWELVAPGIFTLFPDVRFYDYTKVAGRKTPANYDLTFSYSGTNEQLAHAEIRAGRRAAVVFLAHKLERGRWRTFKQGADLPAEFWGLPVVDGDVSDIRPLDPALSVVGLRWKTPAGREIDPSSAGYRFVVPAYKVTDRRGVEYMVASVTPRHQAIASEEDL